MSAAPEAEQLRIAVDARIGEVSALVLRPQGAVALLVLAHGAGAGMRHRFMEGIAGRLAAHRVATLRYQFPYMERGLRRPDPPAVLIGCVRAAVETARDLAGGLPVHAGGKSLGGRMSSQAAAAGALPVRGLIFFGFPLHAAGRPGRERATHLARVDLPMLFLQGSRDRLADLPLLRAALAEHAAHARLQVVEDADHSFHVPKSSGRSDAEVCEELAAAVERFVLA